MSDIERTTTQLPERRGAVGVRARPREQGDRPPPRPLRPVRGRPVHRAEDGQLLRDDRPGQRGAARGDRRGRRGGRRPRGPRGPRGLGDALARHAGQGAGEVPLPGRPCPAGALARVRRPRDDEQRQADQGVPRRRRPARGRALLLLRGMGGQARVRVPGALAAPARRRGADHAVELPAADVRVEARAGARDREHRDPQAGLHDAAHGAVARRGVRAGGPSRRAS